jgi:hypothetical protein
VHNNLFKYPNVSAGYIGKKTENMTLNSQFYYLFHSGEISKDSNFPQRLPRIDFFEELKKLEGDIFEAEFSKNISFAKKVLKDLQKLPEENLNASIFYFNFLLRHGEFMEIVNFALPVNPKINLEDYWVMALLKHTALIELSLCQGKIIDLRGLVNLGDQILKLEVSSYLKIRVLNRLVVYALRHKGILEDQVLYNFEKSLWKLLEEVQPACFDEYLTVSVAYRGIAMSNRLSSDKKSFCMQEVERISRSLKAQDSTQELIYRENLYTSRNFANSPSLGIEHNRNCNPKNQPNFY